MANNSTKNQQKNKKQIRELRLTRVVLKRFPIRKEQLFMNKAVSICIQ